jgi:hypothetical protein
VDPKNIAVRVDINQLKARAILFRIVAATAEQFGR